jgi:pyruvate dehydrogenase E2 component (dihydrolipoamide acetyltransferase)
MEVGSVVEWLKHDGDPVKEGDVLFTLQSDKSINEIASLDSGVLRIPPDSPAPGVEVPIGTVLAYIVQPGEPAPFDTPGKTGTQSVSREARPATSSTAAPGHVSADDPTAGNTNEPTSLAARGPARTGGRSGGPAISPRARRVAGELGVEWRGLSGSGSSGRIAERDVRAAVKADDPSLARISPLARRRARDLGVDLATLARSQPGRRIEVADVEAAASPAASAPAVAPASGIRRLIAHRLAQSAHATAPVTLTTEADATELVHLREQAKADAAGSDIPVPAYNDLFAKIVAVALRDHPDLNASWSDAGVVRHQAVHVGIAVDTERGLLVPVVRDVHEKSVAEIARASATLIERALAGSAGPDDLTGGTFTITNLGHYDVDAFTPIVNLPECAILGIGRIVSKAVVVDEVLGTIAARRMVALSLTFDHRVVDGAPAARFLQRVKRLVEHPYLWVLR